MPTTSAPFLLVPQLHEEQYGAVSWERHLDPETFASTGGVPGKPNQYVFSFLAASPDEGVGGRVATALTVHAID
jgi:hypothetical protein